ncbi:MAG: hypothetical protein AB1499_17190, partial [Nitrospirota bacterium]
MKILFLLPDLFVPPAKGNSYLIYNLLSYVTKHADCDLVLVADTTINKDNAVLTIREHFPSVGDILIFDKPAGIKRSQQRARFLLAGHHQAVGNYWNKSLAEWLMDRTQRGNYDIVHFDMLYMTPYIAYCRNVHTVLVPSDAYSLTSLNIYKNTRNIKYKARLLIEYLIMSRCEHKTYHMFDLVCPVAETDSAYLRKK